MSLSTMTMACNGSGWLNASVIGTFGVASIDWSNMKAGWALANPMDCEERLVEQTNRLKAVNPAQRTYVYRNLVKALPWFSTVREKLLDPAYAGFFLRFAPGVNTTVPRCDTTFDPPHCSEFYHDQEQTPVWRG